MLDSSNVGPQSSNQLKQSASLVKLPEQTDTADITSQSNTLDAARESTVGGKTPGNNSKTSKRQKNNMEKKPSKADKTNVSKEIKKGSSTGKIFELQTTLQRSSTAQDKDLTAQASSNAQPLQNEDEQLNKSEVMSKEEQDGGVAAGRDSLHNGSELMLNNDSTAEREKSQNPRRADSRQLSNDPHKRGTAVEGELFVN